MKGANTFSQTCTNCISCKITRIKKLLQSYLALFFCQFIFFFVFIFAFKWRHTRNGLSAGEYPSCVRVSVIIPRWYCMLRAIVSEKKKKHQINRNTKALRSLVAMAPPLCDSAGQGQAMAPPLCDSAGQGQAMAPPLCDSAGQGQAMAPPLCDSVGRGQDSRRQLLSIPAQFGGGERSGSTKRRTYEYGFQRETNCRGARAHARKKIY